MRAHLDERLQSLWRACEDAWKSAGRVTPCFDGQYMAARGAYHAALGLRTPEARAHLALAKQK